MRTFIAFDLSEEIKTELERLQKELKTTEPDIKWSNPQNIHLTLKFLGEVDEENIKEIKQLLDEVSGKIRPFEITLGKVGAFPSLDRMKVVWVGIDKGSKNVIETANLIEDSSEAIGFFKEDRKFSAHLTLGRVKSGKNKVVLKEKILSIEVKPLNHTIDKIILYKSTLTREGPIYDSLYEIDLKDG